METVAPSRLLYAAPRGDSRSIRRTVVQRVPADRRKRTVPWHGAFLFGALALLLQGAGLAVAQGSEAESNTTCPTAQPLGTVALPFMVDGSLAASDVDFFRLAG